MRLHATVGVLKRASLWDVRVLVIRDAWSTAYGLVDRMLHRTYCKLVADGRVSCYRPRLIGCGENVADSVTKRNEQGERCAVRQIE